MNNYFKFLYECPPLDDFEALKPFSAYLKAIRPPEEEKEERDEETKLLLNDRADFRMREAIQLLIEASYIAAKNSYWEGDINDGPFIVELPEQKILIIFKQLNNGTTFLLSPVELPYLKDWEKKIK